MKNKIILVFLFFQFSLNLFSQTNPCGFSQFFNEIMQDSGKYKTFDHNFNQRLTQFRQSQAQFHLPNQPQCANCLVMSGCQNVKYLLPIVIHVVHRPSDAIVGDSSNVDLVQIQNGIDRLNEAFRNANSAGYPAVNTGIQFCLAKVDDSGNAFSGIKRHSSGLSNIRDDNYASLFNLASDFPSDKYINIFIVNKILNSYGDYVGKNGTATYPSNVYQGIIIGRDFFGDFDVLDSLVSRDSKGWTLPHEMGHYLGLFHPFDFGCSGITSKSCATQGDKCCDVPAVLGMNQNCGITWNTCNSENYNNVDPPHQKSSILQELNQTNKSKSSIPKV